jgi:Flp pilus assembly protein TadG
LVNHLAKEHVMTKTSPAKVGLRKNERGSVLAYTVLSVLFLFFAVGLGVDLSHLYLAKAELQNTADAAALAGASALTNPNPDRIATAVDRAINVMNLNKYNFNKKNYVDVMSLADQRALVRFAINLADFDSGDGLSEEEATAAPDDIRFVRVLTPTVPINIFFSIPILGLTREMNARAVSGLSVPGNVSVCVSPLSAVQCPPGSTNCTLPSDFWGTCPVVNGRGAHDPQPVPPEPCDPAVQTCSGPDPDGDGYCDPKKEFCKGCTYTIRSDPSQGPAPGNYQILACAGNGGNVVRQSLAAYNNCQCGLRSIGDELGVNTQPGDVSGPVEDGLNVRFDDYDSNLRYSADIPPDSNIAAGIRSGVPGQYDWTGISWHDYTTGASVELPVAAHRPGVENRRVLILPTVSHFDQGRSTVTIDGLGGFFMRHPVRGNGDINVEYIGDDIIDVIGFDPNDDNTTNIVTPVLYR